jgi:hypothetical protein
MTINLEMMKQLLQEFVEREALTTEEIKAVEQQSQELGARIEKCRDRLRRVSEDKQKIEAMRQRYAGIKSGGNGSLSAASPAAKKSAANRGTLAKGAAAQSGAVSSTSQPADTAVGATAVAQGAGKEQETSKSQATTGAPGASMDWLDLNQEATQPLTSEVSATEAVSSAASGYTPAQFFEEAQTSPSANPTPAPAQFNAQTDFLSALESSSSDSATSDLPQLSTEAPPGQAESPNPPQTEEKEESPDETVKSINDALRGLFR